MHVSVLGRADNPVNSVEPRVSVLQDRHSLTDEELLRLCARGEQTALEELVRRYQSPLARLLYRFVTSPEDVEEALLSVFLRVWQHAARFQYRSQVSTWLYRIATNVARDFHRQRKKQVLNIKSQAAEQAVFSADAEKEALHRLQRAEQAAGLQRALDRLHPTDRLLLVLYYYEQKDYEQIQAITQLSYTVLKTRLSRARQRLRRFLEEEEGRQANELS